MVQVFRDGRRGAGDGSGGRFWRKAKFEGKDSSKEPF
jgi:hypothetical protein